MHNTFNFHLPYGVEFRCEQNTSNSNQAHSISPIVYILTEFLIAYLCQSNCKINYFFYFKINGSISQFYYVIKKSENADGTKQNKKRQKWRRPVVRIPLVVDLLICALLQSAQITGFHCSSCNKNNKTLNVEQ
ncbi:hypothetical protein T11_12225 [Trichinella zimbabwensis]|uniref:Uncharacterized protein n=1 Tax=Trichinella zimbabwensis TaxID=268475 RepID=A0A0V1I4E4_9BILA|nr:hypothetical protein T11_12225 [Trichinella zimbabwensis]